MVPYPFMAFLSLDGQAPLYLTYPISGNNSLHHLMFMASLYPWLSAWPFIKAYHPPLCPMDSA